MVNNKIKDSQIFSASIYNNDSMYDGSWARLGSSGGYRADPNAQQSWIMVQFYKPTIITGIATQGYNDSTIKEWVREYYLGFSDGVKTGFFLNSGKQGKVSRT